MTTTIRVIGAKGGVGTATVAALHALTTASRGHVVHLSAAQADGVAELAALLGVAWHPGEDRVDVAANLTLGLGRFESVHNVIDAGAAPVSDDDPSGRFLVLRNEYLGLRRAVQHQVRAEGIVMVSEPQRALGRCDIEDVLGLPVVADLAVTPATARSIDAGLLVSRHPRLLLPSGIPRR